MAIAVLQDILDHGHGYWTGSQSAQPDCQLREEAPAPGDLALIARIQSGDEAAARALVHRLYPTIIKSVRRHLPRRTAEEDLVQAVYAKVFNKLSQFSGLVPLEHWVSRITVNTCMSQLQHEMVRPELRMSDLSQEEEAVVQQLVATDDDLPWETRQSARELLEKLLAQLKPEEQLILRLLHLEERSTHEISRMTGWSVSRVKVKAFRARHKLRKIWHKMLQERQACGHTEDSAALDCW
jgi:RNA polymerase sigma-70 factor (ECF subfamily)